MNIEEKFDRVLTSKIREMVSQQEPEAYEIGAWESFEDSAFGSRNKSLRFVWMGLAASFLMAMSLNNLYVDYENNSSLNGISHAKGDLIERKGLLPSLESEFRVVHNIERPFISKLTRQGANKKNSISSVFASSANMDYVHANYTFPSSLDFSSSALMMDKNEGASTSFVEKLERKRCSLFPAKVGVQVAPSIASFNKDNFGWSAGVIAEIPFLKNFSLTGGVLYNSQSIWVEKSQAGENEGEFIRSKSKFAGIELPLNLKYNVFRRKKKEVSISAGVSSIAYLNSSGETEDTSPRHFGAKVNQSKFANVAVSVEFPLEKQMSVMVEPFMKMSLGRSFDQDSNLALVGVNVRLNYSLAKLN